MVVFCRSNDIVWGCYGANAVHFSMLLEYVAARVGIPVGHYTQISVNWHAYKNVWDKMLSKRAKHDERIALAQGEELLWASVYAENPYEDNLCRPHPLMTVTPQVWDEECRRFITQTGRLPIGQKFTDPFFSNVAWPLVCSHDHYIDKNFEAAYMMADQIQSPDWALACKEWLHRRSRKS